MKKTFLFKQKVTAHYESPADLLHDDNIWMSIWNAVLGMASLSIQKLSQELQGTLKAAMKVMLERIYIPSYTRVIKMAILDEFFKEPILNELLKEDGVKGWINLCNEKRT